ncbi:MAG: Rrf2 family transcriptional regulator [Puia sp.]|nr:Rrf2 family transcriptional regulator [Puia sp.]
MDNVEFATALHTLTLLAGSEDVVSSAFMASSINVNPVVVRKSLARLRSLGLVETREGKGGGARLAKPASSILLSDIYKAVNKAPLLGRTNHPNPDCPVGRQINERLYTLYEEADKAILEKLESITLADFRSKFK